MTVIIVSDISAFLSHLTHLQKQLIPLVTYYYLSDVNFFILQPLTCLSQTYDSMFMQGSLLSYINYVKTPIDRHVCV